MRENGPYRNTLRDVLQQSHSKHVNNLRSQSLYLSK
jgi:hypothetical protein